MATSLTLDDALVNAAVEVGHHRTKKEAVTAALTEYVKARKRLAILDWVGKVEYDDDYDPKKARRARRR
jgi:Arc/MetJ family transcription regulator